MVYPARSQSARSQLLVARERPSEYGPGPQLLVAREHAPEYGPGPQLLVAREHAPEYGSGPERDGYHPLPDTPGLAPDTPERKAELDALEDLGDEIATLAAHIHAATQRMLELIAGPTPAARVPPTAGGAGS